MSLCSDSAPAVSDRHRIRWLAAMYAKAIPPDALYMARWQPKHDQQEIKAL